MIERLIKFILGYQKLIFFLVVLVVSMYFFSYRFFVTGDGPAHLYNANLILEFFNGAEPPVSTYFEMNSFPVPNWTGHLILAFFNLFLPIEVVEKVFLFLYFFGFVYSFKYFIQSYNPNAGWFSLIIIPFGISLFVHSGFYNFCLSFIFLFLVIGFFVRHKNQMNLKKGIVMAMLILLLYFSHVTITLFAIFTLFVILFWDTLLIAGISFREKISIFFKKSIGLFLICLLGLIFIFFYTRLHVGELYYTFIPTKELVAMLGNISPLVGHGPGEHLYTRIYLLVAIFLFVFAIVKKIRNRESSFKFKREDSFILVALILLIGYFILPDSDGKGGYISVRILYLFYLLVFARAILMDLPAWLKNDAVIIVLVTLYFHLQLKDEGQSAMSKWARMTTEAGDFIQPNSVILPINCSSHWQAIHLPKYLGAKKPMVILENYEAGHIYFPLVWKKNLPIPSTKSTHPDAICKDYFQQFDQMKFLPDYLFFYGFSEIPMPLECAKSDSADYLQKYASIHKNDFCQLYQLIK